MNTDNISRIIHQHMMANNLVVDRLAGRVIYDRVVKKLGMWPGNDQVHNVTRKVIEEYILEKKRKEYNKEFDELLK